jgi:ATP-dependent Clp protease adaptor protein ClpS
MNLLDLDQLPDTDILVGTDEETDKNGVVIVHNDDWNTFEHVINCFVSLCGHTVDEAGTHAWAIHKEGKSTVKEGSRAKMTQLANELRVQGLKAVYVDNEE